MPPTRGATWRWDSTRPTGPGGPFRFLRHPIYLGLNLLAIGSALWDPAFPVWIGAVLMIIGSELRGRSEERLLAGAFGSAYTDYLRHTKRFIPGVY